MSSIMSFVACKLPGDATIATSMCFSPQLNLTCIALNNGSIHLLNSESCTHIAELRCPEITCLWSLAVENDMLVAGGVDGSLQVWDLNTRKCTSILKGHSNTVRSIHILSPSKRIISGSKDGTIRLWDVNLERADAILSHLDQGPIRTIALARDDLIFAGTYDANIVAWELETGTCQDVMKGHDKGRLVNAIDIDTKQNFCVSGATDCRIIQWDLATRKSIKIITAHRSPVVLLKICRHSLISVSSDGVIKHWNMTDWSEKWSVPAHEGSVTTLAFDGQHVVTGGVDGRISVLHAETGVKKDLGFKKADALWKVALLRDKVLAIGRVQEESIVWMLPIEPC